MPEVQIYKLDLTAGDITVPDTYRPTTWGGPDTPIAEYPELASAENIHRAESAGASGQHVIDAVDTADYTISWFVLTGIGDKTYGQYDCYNGGLGIKCRFKQFFKASALAEAGYSAPINFSNGSTNPETTPGFFGGNLFLQIEWYAEDFDTGPNFYWNIRYRKPNLPIATWNGYTFGNSNPSLTGPTDGLADDEEHEVIITMLPATVAVGFTGSGLQGSSVVNSDGAISIAVDGTVVHSISGVPFVINYWQTTNPEWFYGKGLWHGD